MRILVQIAVMAGVTYLIRMIPFTFFRHRIESRFVRGFLYYIPYAVLAAMTIPAVFSSTGNPATAAVGAAVALVLAWFDLPLIVVASSAALAVLLAGMFV